MKSPKVKWHMLTVLTLLGLIPMSGCQTNTQTGAALGAGAGSLAGAIIGHQTGHKGAGAVIGGLAGGLTGAAIGNAKDAQEERDAAITHASHVQANRRAAAQAAEKALTNSDVIYMTQSGLSETIILNAIHTRGGRFRDNPEALRALKAANVSDTVVIEMMKYSVR